MTEAVEISIPPLPADHRWFILQTERNSEARVHEAVERKQFPAFFPTHFKMISHARKVERVRRPLYEQYTFVAFDLSDRPMWAQLLHIRGVSHILGMQRRSGSPIFNARPGSAPKFVEGRLPVPMPTREVETLRRIAALHNGSIPIGDEGIRALTTNDRVRVIAGAFAGWEAIVSEDKGLRVQVLLDIFGRRNKTSIPRDDLVLLT